MQLDPSDERPGHAKRNPPPTAPALRMPCGTTVLPTLFRNQLKTWLIRHLIASNDGDGDLMAKAIAADGDEDGHNASGNGTRNGYAGKGAPGRESSLSGRVS